MKKGLAGIGLLTISCLYGLLAAIIIFITIIAGGDALGGILISIIILFVQFLISPFLTDLTMKWFYKANFECKFPDYFVNFVNEICKKYNMEYPKIGYIDDGAPNAFTYGINKNNARIVVTRGIFELLSEEEVKAVVGHELGHAVHNDMLYMTIAQVVPLVLYALYETFTSRKSNNNKNDYFAAVGYIAYVLYVLSQYIILFLSRTREYYADDFSVEETKNPNALAEALVKIGFGLSTSSAKSKVGKSNALGIFDSKTSKSMVVTCTDNNGVNKEKIKQAMKWEQWNLWAKWFEFNSTHPLISNRLLEISKKSSKFGQEPYIVFDLEKPESYADDFIIELLIKFAPYFMAITFLIIPFMFDKFNLLSVGLLLTFLFSYISFKKVYKSTEFKEYNVSGLLSEVKVSGITSIPCTIKGRIIGKGDPGCVFSEDYVMQDETGIIFLDYKQPLKILDKLFALLKSNQNINKEVIIHGWYRRSPVPYIEIYDYTIDGKTKKIYTFALKKIAYFVFILLSFALTIMFI